MQWVKRHSGPMLYTNTRTLECGYKCGLRGIGHFLIVRITENWQQSWWMPSYVVPQIEGIDQSRHSRSCRTANLAPWLGA